MNHNKLILFLFLLFTSVAMCQPVCGGKMFDGNENKIVPICFLRSLNPIGNTTKYTIIVGGIEIYDLQFEYHTEGDSITIKFYDKENTTVKKETVRFKSEDSHFVICDFNLNIKPIINQANYRILFGIDHPDQQFITLYQFQALGRGKTYFHLQDVPESVMKQHLEAVSDKEAMDNIRLRHALSVTILRNEMERYKDSVINKIKEEENRMSIREAKLAKNDMQADFTKRMDRLFIPYFQKIHTYNEEIFDVSFRFACDYKGNIAVDTIKSISFKMGPAKSWFRDSFIVKLAPMIEQGNYPPLTETISKLNLHNSFKNWFENRFNADQNLAPKDIDSFTVLEAQILNDLDEYKNRVIYIPAIYTYSFKYSSSVKNAEWRYSKEGTGTDKFVDKSRDGDRNEPIAEKLKEIFRARYGHLSNGKYDLQISTVSLNNGVEITNNIKVREKE